MRLPSTARLGVFALALGILVYVPVYLWVNTRTLVPLDIPVNLVPGHIRTGNFRINTQDYFSIQFAFASGASPGCYNYPLRTRQLTFVGNLPVSAPGGAHGGITEGKDLGEFQGKPGNYNLDVEVLSAAREFDRCLPHLVVEADWWEFRQWDDTLTAALQFCVFCELLGVALLLAAASTRSRRRSLDELRLRIFSTDPPLPPLPPSRLKPERSIPWLLIVGLSGIGTGIAVCGVDSDQGVFFVFSLGVGLAFLLAYRFASLRQRPEVLPFSTVLPEHKPTWGITRLRSRGTPFRYGQERPRGIDVPAIALILSLVGLVILVPTCVIHAVGEGHSQGLYVSVLRKGVLPSTIAPEVTAPLLQIYPKGRIFLNYKATTWERLPDDLDRTLLGLPVQVVYLEGDNDLLFMDAARALDTIHQHGAKAILITPDSRATLFPPRFPPSPGH